MGTAETTRAIAAGKKALGRIPDTATRRKWLEDARDARRAEKEGVGGILWSEHGKPWKEAQGEVEYAASVFDYYAATIEDSLKPEVQPGKVKNCTWTLYKRPVGVVGLITPWNFPIGM